MPIRCSAVGLFICLILTSSASAQLHDHGSGLARGVPDICAHDPAATMVPAGTSRTFSGTFTASCVGIHGAVTFDGTLRLRVTTILVYDDGMLTVAPGAQITYLNTAIDTAFDPEQFSNGLIGFGMVRVNGTSIAPYAPVSADIPAGAMTIPMLAVPPTWLPGHRLVVPDTRQIARGDLQSNGWPDAGVMVRKEWQNEICTIASKTTTSITCAQPLVYAHPGAHAVAVSTAAGNRPALDRYPFLANLTRSIEFRSENPMGVRAHTIFMARADVIVNGASFVCMGRTNATPLDDTTFDSTGAVTHVGLNQRAHYALHFHHDFGPVNTGQTYQFQATDNAIECGGRMDVVPRWALTVHNSSWGLVQDNVVLGPGGAGIVGEDGDEINNLIDRNYVIGFENPVFANLPLGTYDNEGNKGTHIWFRNGANTITNNICAAGRSCLAFYTGNAEDGPFVTTAPQRIPLFKGADTAFDNQIQIIPTYLIPMGHIDGNQWFSMSNFGMEFWWSPFALIGNRTDSSLPFIHFPVTNSTCWHQGTADGACLSTHYSDVAFDGVTGINDGGQGFFSVTVNDGGAVEGGNGQGWSEMHHVDARGFGTAWARGGQLGPPVAWRFGESFFQTLNGFDLINTGESATVLYQDLNGHPVQTSQVIWENVQFAPIAGQPLATIQTRFAFGTANGFEGRRRYHLNVKNYQGVTGQDFRVYFTGQLRSEPAPPYLPADVSHGRPDALGCPSPTPLTNQECWTQYGTATLMELAPMAPTTRPEIVGLIGPLPLDDPLPPVPPPPGPNPPPVPPTPTTCTICVPTITVSGDGNAVWTLGDAWPDGGWKLLRNGTWDAMGVGKGFVLSQGRAFTLGNSGLWYRWQGPEFQPAYWQGGFPEPVPDNAPPPALTLTVSPNLTATTTTNAPIGVSYAAPVAGGGVPPLTASCTPISGSLFPVGISTVTCTAHDSAGQSKVASFTVAVAFSQPQTPDPCKDMPLRITGLKFPVGQTGNKTGTWNSGNFALVKAAFLWNPQRFEATDGRGCTASVLK